MKRREFLKLSLGAASVAALSSQARGEAALKETPKEIRIGTHSTQESKIQRGPASLVGSL